jgi:hypothetical protein
MVRDQKVSHLVPFVPVGWGRRLQRIEGKSLDNGTIYAALKAMVDIREYLDVDGHSPFANGAAS